MSAQTGRATSITVYPSPGIHGVWNWSAYGRRGGMMSTASNEAEAWRRARAFIAEATAVPSSLGCNITNERRYPG